MKLIVPPQENYEANEDGTIIPSPVSYPLRAIVRIRIPLKRPVIEASGDNTIEEDENGEEVKKEKHHKEESLTARSKDDTQYEEEVPEDKIWCVNPIGDNQKIFVLH